MSTRRRDFLLLSTLAAAAVATALGQTAAPAAGPSAGAAPSAQSIPDFSGIWAHPYLTGFEPPASGPGPVTNRSRRNGVGNFQQLVGDYANPTLKPAAAEVVKQHGQISLAGKGYPTPSNQCWPGGVPYVFWDFLMEMFQQPDKITMIYRHGNEIRHVRMNEPHPAHAAPSWYGDSVGRYEGDTLVIDTVGMKMGPYSMIDWYGTPRSEALHVIERYRMLDYEAAKEGFERDSKQHNNAPGMPPPNASGKYLQLAFTIEDKNMFTTPWTATMTYRSDGGPLDWPEMVCAENRNWYPGKEADVPRADKPDF
jgi:hypothetical protein